MKKNAVFLCLMLFVSCKEKDTTPIGNTYYFEAPQPLNDSELKAFPRKFQYLFMDSDSSYLKIHENNITDEYYHKIKIDLQSFDSLKLEFDILDKEIISKKYKEMKYQYRKLKDSIEITDIRIDTIFQFSVFSFLIFKRQNGLTGILLLVKKILFIGM
jgi:hypothetical protein